MNLLIIGAGPAGEAAAKTARKQNPQAHITVIERENAGGLCLNKGCIPSKTLLEQVHQTSRTGDAIEWMVLQKMKTDVVTSIRSQLESSFKTLKINLIRGTAQFHSDHEIQVLNSDGATVLPFDKAIIATGTETIFPPPLDQHRDALLDSDRMLDVVKTPVTLVVVGGGAIGCEFACLMNAAGSQVTIIELKDGLLPGEDPAVVNALASSFEARGIAVKTGVKVKEIEKSGANWNVTLSDGSSLSAEAVLVCVGRAPNYTPLMLEKAGVKTDKRALILNDTLQTSNPNVYAAGDAATTKLAHAAAAQGEAAAINALGGNKIYDDRFVPRCLYSWPEVASVGQWKYQLEEKNLPVKTSRAFFKGSAKAMASKDADGFVQIVSDPGSGKILGAQIIGPHATELIHIFSIGLYKEMTLAEMAGVMFAHPTLGEIIKEAAKK